VSYSILLVNRSVVMIPAMCCRILNIKEFFSNSFGTQLFKFIEGTVNQKGVVVSRERLQGNFSTQRNAKMDLTCMLLLVGLSVMAPYIPST